MSDNERRRAWAEAVAVALDDGAALLDRLEAASLLEKDAGLLVDELLKQGRRELALTWRRLGESMWRTELDELVKGVTAQGVDQRVGRRAQARNRRALRAEAAGARLDP